jgi:segregation and condensation protein B
LPHSADRELARLEAILFLAREPLASRKLSQYANLADGTQARTLVRRLNEQYDAAGRAFRVEQVAGGYQLLTRRQLAPWLRRLAHVPGETRLSAPALETLAVIAYRQPVPRADIEAIRGVNCGEILRQLMDRDLVRIGGRSEELGRPYLYATTKRFLELFGLNQIDELPHRVELRTSPLPAAQSGFPADGTEPNSKPETEPAADLGVEPIDEMRGESTFG